MDANYIRWLFEYLPDDSAYFKQNGVVGDRPGQIAVALNDPKFGWNIVRSLQEDDLRLPTDIGHLQILNAWSYLKGAYDPATEQAYALMHPVNTTQRNLLKALLISGDVTLEGIARCMRLPLKVVRIFDQLLFNVRDRLDEPGYITRLLHPDGIQLNRDTDDEASLLLRAGAQHGAREVLRLAGVRADGRGQSLDEVRGDLELSILRAAKVFVRHGGAQEVDSPTVDMAMKLIVADKRIQRDASKQNGEFDPLLSISASFPVMETLRQLSQPSFDQMIKLGRGEAGKKPEGGLTQENIERQWNDPA